MAYENGCNIKNYLNECINEFRENNGIFKEALQVLVLYTQRKDWPYCISELNKATALILGQGMSGVAETGMKYCNDPNIEWPSDIPEKFKKELNKFSKISYPIIEEARVSVLNPLGIKSITKMTHDINKYIVRIIRFDGEFLDVQLSNYDIDSLCQSLNSFKY